jgi:hypothetical protein
MSWRHGSDAVVLGSYGATDIAVDLKTGAITAAPPPQAAPVQIRSPDGRFAVRVPWADASTPLPADDCTGLPFEVHLDDLVAGTSSVVLACPSGNNAHIRWLTSTKFAVLVTSSRVGQGSSGPAGILIVDAMSRKTVRLTAERETGTEVFASKRGDRFLLTGPRLRLFSADGALLADYGPAPAGYAYGNASFSPDGQAIAFVLTPAAFPSHLP